ncbi:MAG TPA: hypothetical protein PLL67_02415, partial [Gammaproteobacteria bacterium]|nr:hypothetical protein [Gammaproteobacteria bacterium]
VDLAVLVKNYKITATVLGQTECAIGKSPSAEVTAQLITALVNTPPPMKPVISGTVLDALTVEAQKNTEYKKALELYQNFDTNHPEPKKAGPKASA